MAYGDFKELTRKTATDKKLCDKGFNFTENQKYDRCQRDLPLLFCKFFDKRWLSSAVVSF